MAKEERKAFNFYRSYYDIVLEIPESERLAFLMGIIEMQFTGKEPELTGMAKFAFISQKHSIVKQIEGYNNGVKTPPRQGAYKGARKGLYQEPLAQGEEKGQEEGQVQVEVFGTPSQVFFTVQKKYIHDKACKVYQSGFKDYCNKHLIGFWFKKEYMVELIWREWNSKMFKDHSHVSNVLININNGQSNNSKTNH